MKALRNLILLTSVVLLTGTAYTVPFTLVHGDSSVTIDPESSLGMRDWRWRGVDHLFQSWYWYRIGPDDPERPIHFDMNGSRVNPVVNLQSPNKATVSFTHPLFTFNVTYELLGGVPGDPFPRVYQEVMIHNTSNDYISFWLFDYTDLDIGGDAGDDTATHHESDRWHTITQSDQGFPYPVVVSAFKMENHLWEIGGYPSILQRLNDGYPDDLTNSGSPFVGDATFAFEWVFGLNPDQKVFISKYSQFTPEPSSTIALGVGLIVLLRLRRRKHTV
jgi:hypothetical protein